jgi:hypothetical protein
VKRRFPQLFAAAVVLVFAAASTPTALAGTGKPKHHKKASDCGVSASCVYVEHYKTGGGSVAAGTQTGPPLKLPKKISKALHKNRKITKHHAKQVKVLNRLVTDPGAGAQRTRFLESSDQMVAPSPLGAAFDLGAGPIALFAALLAGAVLGAGGLALRRRKRPSSL